METASRTSGIWTSRRPSSARMRPRRSDSAPNPRGAGRPFPRETRGGYGGSSPREITVMRAPGSRAGDRDPPEVETPGELQAVGEAALDRVADVHVALLERRDDDRHVGPLDGGDLVGQRLLVAGGGGCLVLVHQLAELGVGVARGVP